MKPMPFKLATVNTPTGPAAAILTRERAVEVDAVTGVTADRDMTTLLSDWDRALPQILAETDFVNDAGLPLASAALLAPVTRPGGIFCAGANYKDHAQEMAARAGRAPAADPRTLGLRSWHFLKTAHCLSGPGSTVSMHPRAKQIDWEAELAVVIGRKAFQVSERDALDYVLGYTIANDLSARDLGRREPLPDSSSFKQDWVSHKNWDGSCVLGPWITLRDSIDDPHHLNITLEVNGVPKQSGNTRDMIFSINEQIADLSSNFTLWPGDIILTGTPAGVGAARGEFLNKGDVVKIRIAGLGELVHSIG
jgi:2-keto-4-pentenoate hydratase/2-oxohepta-3-ene-1,7-dioic acid hydratase in catechol pathway